MIAKANQAEHRGDIEEALSILRDISIQNIDTFIVSREKMANIYLKHRTDRRLYVSCYRDICDRVPTIQSFVLLGDAYMNILEVIIRFESRKKCDFYLFDFFTFEFSLKKQ